MQCPECGWLSWLYYWTYIRGVLGDKSAQPNASAKTSTQVKLYLPSLSEQQAIACTVQAASPEGDQRVGVVWHTQGSGKSLTMAFYTGKIIQHRAMENPTLVVLTDRNDLDDQLFSTFAACQDLLRQKPRSHPPARTAECSIRGCHLHHHSEIRP